MFPGTHAPGTPALVRGLPPGVIPWDYLSGILEYHKYIPRRAREGPARLDTPNPDEKSEIKSTLGTNHVLHVPPGEERPRSPGRPGAPTGPSRPRVAGRRRAPAASTARRRRPRASHASAPSEGQPPRGSLRTPTAHAHSKSKGEGSARRCAPGRPRRRASRARSGHSARRCRRRPPPPPPPPSRPRAPPSRRRRPRRAPPPSRATRRAWVRWG